jgi:thiol-disulfide isomerase/thioredoxin
MLTRWIVAAVAALGLSWTVITTDMPWLVSDVEVESVAGEACPADARDARLDFTLKDINDKPVTLSDYKGKVILLDFWATWCGPCKIEIPWFIEFQQKYGDAGLQVIGVSVDDPIDKLRPYAAAMKMSYVVLQGLGHTDLVDAYGPLVALPTTALISRDGKVCLKHTGLVSKASLEAQIKALL